MILSCPTCATRYRHEALPVGSPAQCGQCDRVFPVPPTRTYFVHDLAPASRALVGARAGVAASIGARPVLIEAEDFGAPPSRVDLDRETTHGESAFELAEPRQPARPDEEHRPTELRSIAAIPSVPLDRRAAPRREAPPQAPESSRSAVGVLVVWMALGAGMGLALSFVLGGPTRIWSAAGVATGLVAGWGWLRWMSGRS